MFQVYEARRQVIDAGLTMLRSNLVVGTWGNISCRVDGKPYIAITPSGMSYDQIATDDIVIMDLDGKIIEGERKPSTEVPLHLAVYRARPEINAVVHTHSTYATALACAHREIPPVVEELVQIVGGEVRVAHYALPGTKELGENALRAAEGRNAVLLANHGVLGMAESVEEALKVCLVVEKAAQITVFGTMMGSLVPLSPEDIRIHRQYYLHQYGQKGMAKHQK